MSTKYDVVKGWIQKGSRRAILRNPCCDISGKFYECNTSVEHESTAKASIALRIFS